MPEYLKILGNVLPLFLLMGVGAVVRRQGVLNERADRTLLDMSVHLLLPCLILDHVMANEALRRYDNLLWSPFLGFFTTAASLGVAAVAARWWGFEHDAQRRTFAFVVGICNYGYIPVPLIDVLYGANALGVLFLFNLGTETAFWTVGFGMFERRSLLLEWRRVFTSPVRAILLGVTINLATAWFGVRLDDATLNLVAWGWPVKMITDTIHLAGLCAIPLALLLIGATMADFWAKFRSDHGAGVMALSIAVRNLICPAGFVLLAWLLPISRELKETLVVQAAMPAGVFTLVLSRHHGGSVPVALQVIFSTSAAALITLPLWIHFGIQLAGVK
ncbi:MAG: AEC family transporter [Methylacidiphilales bacterium]|nr:AEC family transporter [Candidatus Methylacidiphilales bacterium]